MPLIRYETGDNAKISKKGCSCQKTFPTVHNIVGRRDNFILTPSGYKIPTVNFYTMFEHFLEIEQWQIVQNNIDNLLFIIKPSSNISVERIKHLKKNIFERVGSKINFEIDISGKFIQLHEGKINPFISQL